MKSKESRKYHRVEFVFPVRVGYVSDESLKSIDENSSIKEQHSALKVDKYFHAFSDNISEGGIKIFLKDDLKSGVSVPLRFDLLIDTEVRQVEALGKVKWCKKNSKNEFETGFEFECLQKSGWKLIEKFMLEYA